MSYGDGDSPDRSAEHSGGGERRQAESDLMTAAPTVSVITVSFKDLDGLKRTTESVQAQIYDGRIQHIVIDGGSGDEVTSYLSNAEPGFAYWQSQPDDGNFDAMNQGIAHSSGELLWFMNSGDCFSDPDAIASAVRAIAGDDPREVWGYGINNLVGRNRRSEGLQANIPFDIHKFLTRGVPLPHQAAFFGSSLVREGYEVEFGIAADQLFMYRIAMRREPITVNRVLCDFDVSGVGSVRPRSDHMRDVRRICDRIGYYSMGGRRRSFAYMRLRELPGTSRGIVARAVKGTVRKYEQRRGAVAAGRNSPPLRLRLRALISARVYDAIDALRTPVRRPEVLLLADGAPKGKVYEVESRLLFLFEYLEASPRIRIVDSVSPVEYLRSSGVAAVESTAIASSAFRRLPWVVDLDYENNGEDAWALMDLAAALTHRPSPETLATARRTLVDRVAGVNANGPRPAYVFGTGPSLQLARERSFADGTVIVCNTIVRDPELWQHLAPEFLVAADAIYHFGHTPHARAFRADALRRLKESDSRTLFVYPATFDVIVRHEFKDVESLLVPIPVGDHTELSVDLTERYSIPTLGNVLGILLVPLACTLSRDVRLWGFDGRAPTDSGFWSNSSRHSYPELMQSMRDSNPAFFADLVPQHNEAKYFRQVFGDELEQRFTEAEHAGFEFRMLHRSWTPSLQKRYRAPLDDQN